MNADATDEIAPGKRLVRADDRGLSLGERIANGLYRLTWRTPLHGLRLKGRYPLKLLGVPADPIVGDAGAGRALVDGTMRLRGERVALIDVDFVANGGASPALSAHIDRFGWLRDLDAGVSRTEGAPIAEDLVRRWLDRHGAQASDPAWSADRVAWRLLHWAAHAPLILSSTDLVYRSAVLNALARGARHLDRGTDRAPVGLPRITAWAGVVAAGLLIPGGDVRLGFGEGGLIRALAVGISDDGGIITRAPGEQVELIELLSMLAAVYDMRRVEWPIGLQSALERAVAALHGITLGDGALSSWQGAGPIDKARVAAVVAASRVRTRPLRQARDWGYQRMAGGATVVVADMAPPPPSRVTKGGCASTLAFELSDGERRLIVNCGGTGGTGAIPVDLAKALRTTAAHSTLTLGDSNSTAIHADGTLGAGVGAVEVDREELEGGSRIDASHEGYARRFGLIHKRTLALSGTGRELRGEDALLPAPKRKTVAGGTFAIRFHLAPGVEVTATADGQAALLRIDHGALWQFRCRGGRLSIEDSLWLDADGRPHATQQFVVEGDGQHMTTITIRRALLSVSDKTDLVDLGSALAAKGVELVSTGGTAKALRDAGLAVRDVSDLTGFPEMMDGRVKTLHPLVHGGLLAVRDNAEHVAAMAAHGIGAIDLVVVNLYPFAQTVTRGAARDEVIENIDIGGPSMVRSAAKNHASVAIVTDPADYEIVARGETTLDERKRLAAKAYALTAQYDATIASWFAFADQREMFPASVAIPLRHGRALRYGENPHQQAALYLPAGPATPGVAQAEQVQGKALSYNNFNDADAALELVAEFRDGPPTVVIVKHANPCGVATADTLLDAYRAAFACDTVSAFGGIVACNRPLDGPTAAAITEIFTEVVIAPGADEAARAAFARKKNLRLLLCGELGDPLRPGLSMKSIAGGFLLQSRDSGKLGELNVVTKRTPTDQELADARFAWTVAKHVKSNAIVYAKDGATAGIGAGQMNRLESARIAAWKAKDAADKAGWDEPRTIGSAVASDAFFPFADGLLAAVEAGATCVIQPGGSIRDDEVIAAADAADLAMVFTGLRHFRH